MPVSTIVGGAKSGRDHHTSYRVALREVLELIQNDRWSSSRVFFFLAIVSDLGSKRCLELHA